jgi:hypothetical protein
VGYAPELTAPGQEDKVVRMLPLLFAAVVFTFLVAGAAAFVICAAIPPLRRYALSAALWFACCGPTAVALIVLVILAEAADAYLTSPGHRPSLQGFQIPALPLVPGWGWLILGASVMAVVATIAAWLHQKIVRRSTLALFQLYATAVSVAIGAVFGLCLEGWMLSAGIRNSWVWWLISMPVLMAAFGFFAYRSARSLRGKAPTRFTWISVEEYDGTQRDGSQAASSSDPTLRPSRIGETRG